MQKQPSKAQKRRQHQAEKDAEREAELEAEHAQQGESEQAVEDKQLREMLTPLGLTIRAIQVLAINCYLGLLGMFDSQTCACLSSGETEQSICSFA